MKPIVALTLLLGASSSIAYDSGDMERALLYGACTACDLVGGDFRGRNLSGVDFSFSNLSYSNFTGASLQGADMTKTNLTGANLAGANLNGALLSEAVWIDGRVCQAGSVGSCN